MNIVAAFDSFKGCLTSKEVSDIVSEAVKSIVPDAGIESLILADGGEGTLEAVVECSDGQIHKGEFTNLQGEKVSSSLGFVDDLCIIESAQTVGLPMSDRKNLFCKSSGGIGEQILYAVHHGYGKFAIGLGGSGTNDCGIGMLQALGFRFFDSDGEELLFDITSYAHLATIDEGLVDERVLSCEFTFLSDVSNPLYGKNGATYVYGLQKGVSPDELPEFDLAMKRISEVAGDYFGKDRSNHPGAGAAGGLGYAFLQFLNAESVSGIDYILNILDTDEKIRNCDYVFTGEGKSDTQTANGKVPVGVAAISGKYKKPVILVSGALDSDAYKLHDHGISFMTSIQDYPASVEEVMKKDVAAELLSNRIKEIIRLLQLST